MIDAPLDEISLQLISKQLDALLSVLLLQKEKFAFGTWVGNLCSLKRLLELSGYRLTPIQEQKLFDLYSTGLASDILKQYIQSNSKAFLELNEVLLYFINLMNSDSPDWGALKSCILPINLIFQPKRRTWQELPKAQTQDDEKTRLFFSLDDALQAWQHRQSVSLSSSPARQLPLEAYKQKVGLCYLLSQHRVLMEYFQVAITQCNYEAIEKEIDWHAFSEQFIKIMRISQQFLLRCDADKLQSNRWQHDQWGVLSDDWKYLLLEMSTQSVVFFEWVNSWLASEQFIIQIENSTENDITQLLPIAKAFASIRETLRLGLPTGKVTSCLQKLIHFNQKFLNLPYFTIPAVAGTDERWRAQLAEARAPFIPALQQGGTDVLNQQGQLSQQIKALIQTIAADCTTGLGQPPCELVLYLLGSHSREDGTLYSDAEFALVYEPYENKSLAVVYGYLHTWLRLFQLAIVSLGETPLSGQSQFKFHIDTEVARKQWGVCQEDMHSEMYNSVMLAFTLDEWHQYLHGRHMKDGSEVDARNQEIAAFRARLGDEDFFALLNADSVYQYSSLTSRETDNEENFSLSENQMLDTRFGHLLRSMTENVLDGVIIKKILAAALSNFAQSNGFIELGDFYKNDVKMTQGQLLSLLKCHSILQRAFDTKAECSAQNQTSLKLQYQNPLIFFVQAVKLWCPLKAKTTVGILQEAQQRGWLPIGFVELWKAALEGIARLRNSSSLVCDYQNDVINLSELTPHERKFLEGLEHGLLVPLQNEFVQLADKLRANGAQLEISYKTLYDVSWNVLMQFLTKRSQWCLQDEGHPWVNILSDYPDRCGFTPLGEKKLKRWQQHLISTYLIHQRSPYIVYTPGLDADKLYYLPQDLGDRLFDLETGLPRTDFNNQSTSRTHYSTDRHAVHLIDDVFFKINAPIEKNLFNQTKHLPSEYEIFGRELAVQAIHYSLGGDSLAPGALWRVEVQAARTCVYWVWLSQACEGEALTTVIKEKPNQLLRLTEMSVSEHFILAFVTAQLDGQPENFMLVLKGDAFKLIGFDNGLAFGQCIKKTGFFSKAVPVLKSAVLLFPQMQSARFDPRTAEKIRLLDVPEWLSTIQAKIDNINQVWARILSPLSSGVAQDRAGIIIRLPEESSLWMSMVLNRFKTRLQREPITLYAKLFSDLNPQLKGLYQTFHEYNNLYEFSRLQFNELDPASYHAYKTTTPDGPRIVSLSTVAGAQDLREYEAIIANMKATMHLTEQDFVSVNFKLLIDKHNNPDKQAQLLQLKLMEGTTFKKLCLAHCTVLTDEMLARFLKLLPANNALERLDLRGCPNITGKGWLKQLKAMNPRVKILPRYLEFRTNYRSKFRKFVGNRSCSEDVITQLVAFEEGMESLDELYLNRELTENEKEIVRNYIKSYKESFLQKFLDIDAESFTIDSLPQSPLFWLVFLNNMPAKKLKTVLVGDACGKTALAKVLAKRIYSIHYKPTIGVDFELIHRRKNELFYDIQLWDVNGGNRSSFMNIYFKDTKLFILTFGLNFSHTVEGAIKWKDSIYKNYNVSDGQDKSPLIILVGTCADIKSVSESEIKQLRTTIQPVAYVEVSAKTGQGLEELLKIIDAIVSSSEDCNFPPAPLLSEKWLLELKQNKKRWDNFIYLSGLLFYPNVPDPLLYAAQNNHFASVQYFLEGSNSCIKDNRQNQHMFLEQATNDVLKFFINYYSDLRLDFSEEHNYFDINLVEFFILRQDEALIRLAIEKKICRLDDAVVVAARHGKDIIVNFLLSESFTLKKKEEIINSAIIVAAMFGQDVVIKLLLSDKFSLAKREETINEGLLTAASKCNHELISFFLEQNSSVTVRNYSGDTPLLMTSEGLRYLSIRYNNIDNFKGSVTILLEHGASLNETNFSGENLRQLISKKDGLDVQIKNELIEWLDECAKIEMDKEKSSLNEEINNCGGMQQVINTTLQTEIYCDSELTIPPQDIITFWLISKNAQAGITARGGINYFFAASDLTDVIDNEVVETEQAQVLIALEYSP